MNTISEKQRIKEIETQINLLKEQRDTILRDSGLEHEELLKILRIRTNKQTLCQILRDLHSIVDGKNKDKVEQALLIAKKMDARLVEYAGKSYSRSWYDKSGRFIDDQV